MFTRFWKQHLKSPWITWIIGASLIFAMVGCYGAFPLTKTIYDFNGELDGRLIRTIVFWGFLILPVYELAMLGDAIVFNLIEFWTGEELIESASMEQPDGSVITLAPGENGDEAILSRSRHGEVVSSIRFVRVSETELEAYDMNGELAGKIIQTPDGGFQLTDAAGDTLSELTPESIAGLAPPLRP